MIALSIALLAALTPVGGEAHDFGEVLAGTPVHHTFVLKNTGDQPFKVVEVKPTCSLESVSSPSLIPPGEAGEFPVVLTTDSLFGRVLRGLTVRLRAGAREEEVLFTITGVVRHPVEIAPEGEGGPVMGWAGDTLDQVFAVTFHDPAHPRVDILSAEVEAVEGNSVPPVRSSITAAPDGRSARVVLQLDASALVQGEYGHWLNIRTSHPQVPLAQIPVAWLVRDPLLMSVREVVFHAPSIFDAVEVQFPCRAYQDGQKKQPLDEPLGGKGFRSVETRGDMTRIHKGKTLVWVDSSCLKRVPPNQAGQTRYIALSDGKGRPLRIGSVTCAHPLVSAFWRQNSASSCTVGVTLAGAPERDETAVLEVEIQSPKPQRREIPVRLVKE